MQQSEMHYLPLPPGYFSLLVGAFVILLLLIQFGALRYVLLAVNVGGAVIPSVMSAYLLLKHQLWAKGAAAVAIVAIACNWMAEPVPGMGIALPIFVPAAVTTIAALILSREHAAQLAYIGGTLGTLIGADLLNLGKISGLGTPIASIGGAGTFDGIFLIGILAVLLASLTGRTQAATS